MDEDLSTFSTDDRQKIDRAARRNVGSECRLILSAGFALLMVFTFFFAKVTFLPIAAALDVRPFFVWITLSAGVAAVWAFVHYAVFAPRIARAKALSAAFLHAHEQKEREANLAKLKALREKS